jgi:hypothetical protein
MMQTVVAIGLVIGAALALGWQAWRTLQGRRAGCGCEHCPGVKGTAPKGQG